MFSNKICWLPHTLALRLTIWYAAIFAASSAFAFVFVYLLISTFIAQRTDKELQEDISEFAAFFQAEGIQRVKTEMDLDTKHQEAEQIFFRLWAGDGRQLATTDLSSWAGLSDVSAEVLREVGGGNESVVETVNVSSREYAARRIVGTIGPGPPAPASRTVSIRVTYWVSRWTRVTVTVSY